MTCVKYENKFSVRLLGFPSVNDFLMSLMLVRIFLIHAFVRVEINIRHLAYEIVCKKGGEKVFDV